jgi:signal transduction histidine kinase/ligand-binding sensor domain-containing protein/DNA-binding response OmpR family regulator
MLLRLRLRISFFLGFLLSLNCLYAINKPVITYLGIENGLSNNEVTCIYQDHRGFMWFGTYDGLNEFNGYDFKVYRNRLNDSASLVNNRIRFIKEDADGLLWIGTRRGISIYNRITSKFSTLFYRPYKEQSNRLADIEGAAMKQDAHGNIFIGTANQGLLLYNNQTKIAEQLPFTHDALPDTHYYVSALEFDAGNRLWLFIREVGLCVFDYKTKEIKVVNRGIKNGLCMRADNAGNLWIGADDGLYKYEMTTNKMSVILSTHSRIPDVTIDKQNRLWIASDGNGVYILDLPGMHMARFAAPDNKEWLTSTAIFSIYEDRDGCKWIGTLRGGINMVQEEKNRFSTISRDPLSTNTLVNNFILSFCEDREQNLWIGTDGGGLSCWNRRQNAWTNFQHREFADHSLSCNFVCSVLNDYQNNLWIATWGGGINRYNKATHAFERFQCINPFSGEEDKYAWILFEDAQKKLWASTCNDGRLYYYNRAGNRFELFDSRLTNFLSLYEDKSGAFWGGTFQSLIKIDRTEKKHVTYNIGYAVRVIHEDRQSRFWIGTEGGGLLLFNRTTGQFTRYTEAEGLCSNSILNLLEDDKGNLWISTFNGISKFDPQNKTFTNFSQSDGLQSNQFNYNAAITLQSGEFIFGGIKGFNIFYPDSIYNKPHPVKVWLTGIKINNAPVEDDDTYATARTKSGIGFITLPYNKAIVSIDYVALNYEAPDKIKYAYYLDGWDKEWNYVGKSRTANYTRLREGLYTFKVKATDAEGHWLNQEQQLVIKVLPPWYRTWWALLAYVVVFVSLLYLYLQYKAQRAKQLYETALAKMEIEKEKELNEKKLSFFTNVSHEFRAPLTLIINPIKELVNNPGKVADPEDMHIVYRNARRLLSLVDQLLLFRKADAGEKLKLSPCNLYELCHEVYSCFLQQARARNIHYEFIGTNAVVEIMADREKIEIVLFNLISNALKFTPEGGKVIVEVAEKGKDVEVIVTDSGCGIAQHVGDGLFEKFYRAKNRHTTAQPGFGIGLYLVKQFVEAHKGTVKYESKPGEGTMFIVSLSRLGWTDIKETLPDIQATAETANLLQELMGDNDPVVPARPLLPSAEMVTEKKTILLVDDNAEMRQYLRHLFADRFIIYEAENGETGLQKALQHVPDLIISDVVMSGVTGVEFCQKVKSTLELSHIPVILLTATSSPDTKLKGIECGAEDYITKPFEKDFLIARVDNILKGRSTLQQYFLDTVTLQKNTVKVSAEYRDFLDRCIAIIEKEIDNEDFNIKMLAQEMGMSHSNLYKKVKFISGLSVNAFIRYIRLRRAAVLLLSTNTNINEAAMQVGINDSKHFRVQFHKLFGMNPSEYVKKYKGSFDKDFNIVSKG